MSEVKSIDSLITVNIKKDKCKGCWLCIESCPTKHLRASIELNKGGRRFVEIKEESKCIGCGFCFAICPDVCIEIKKTESGVIPAKAGIQD
jgi:2-oxoglutarate ferredoxin oxidoreductase subunit delta